jgi:hypothetical protein
LDQAHQSLVLLPENPLLLVAVADMQAREHQNDSAISSAPEARRRSPVSSSRPGHVLPLSGPCSQPRRC